MVDGQNSIILSFINDDISVPINRVLDKLYKEDYKKYKNVFLELCSIIREFSDAVTIVIGDYDD